MLFTRIAKEKELPIGLTKPNALTIEAIEESRAMMRAKKVRFTNSEGLFNDLGEKKGEA